MENLESGTSPLVSELAQALELVTELGAHLAQPSFSMEFCKSLAVKLLCSTEKSIGMVKACGAGRKRPADAGPSPSVESSPPLSCTPSLLSDASDQPFKCLDRIGSPKKRKTLPRWKRQVGVSSVGGVEGLLEDGHSWRKYGQKDILGAKYPRSYYRCTHRNSQGCQATKQVQRTDDDPSIFDVIYQGTHTCIQKPSSGPAPSTKTQEMQQEREQAQDLLQMWKTSLTVMTEGLGSSGLEPQDFRPASFSFLSVPVGAPMPGCNPFSLPSFSAPDGCRLVAGSSSLFASPGTPESNYFSVSPCDLAEVVSAATSTATTNSPMADFSLNDLFNADFDNDLSSFFSSY